MTHDLPTLEVSLNEITQLIHTMEQGDLSLEQSLSQFERGITLIKHCQKILSAAEQRVKILLQNNPEAALKDYQDIQGDELHESTGQ